MVEATASTTNDSAIGRVWSDGPTVLATDVWPGKVAYGQLTNAPDYSGLPSQISTLNSAVSTLNGQVSTANNNIGAVTGGTQTVTYVYGDGTIGFTTLNDFNDYVWGNTTHRRKG